MHKQNNKFKHTQTLVGLWKQIYRVQICTIFPQFLLWKTFKLEYSSNNCYSYKKYKKHLNKLGENVEYPKLIKIYANLNKKRK